MYSFNMFQAFQWLQNFVHEPPSKNLAEVNQWETERVASAVVHPGPEDRRVRDHINWPKDQLCPLWPVCKVGAQHARRCAALQPPVTIYWSARATHKSTHCQSELEFLTCGQSIGWYSCVWQVPQDVLVSSTWNTWFAHSLFISLIFGCCCIWGFLK